MAQKDKDARTMSFMTTGTMTGRYQTTIPKTVRETLGLSKQSKVAYHRDETGRVFIKSADSDDHDPALGPFLDLLAADMAGHPERLQTLNEGRMERVGELTAGVDIGDIDAPLDPDDD